SDWARDMALIKESGLDCVRFGEFSWAWFEPEEGRFDFSAYDEFMDLAHTIGLQVILCTPTAAPPEWLLHRYPEVRMLDAEGHPHNGGRHMASLRDPNYLRLAERAIIRLAERYRNHPALYAWQIDNEPSLGETVNCAKYDYSPASIRAFQDWMRDRYGSLEQLNRDWQNSFWSRSYTSWEQILPPRQASNPSLWLAWMRFRRDEVTRFILWQRDLLQWVNPDFLLGTNMPECGPLASAHLGQDFWTQAQGLNYVGTDIYCYDRDDYQVEKSIGYSCDVVCSAARVSNAEFWISETQGGPHFSPWSRRFHDGAWGIEFLRNSLLAYSEHGARRVLFFLWRPLHGGQEYGLNGVTALDGSENERTRALPGLLKEAGSVSKEPRPTAYVHYSIDSLALSTGFDPNQSADDSLHGWYRLLTDAGYDLVFLDDKALCRRTWMQGDLLALPYTVVVSPEVAQAIGRARDAKAVLLAGYGTGCFDQHGCLFPQVPGCGLSELLGAEVVATDSMEQELPVKLRAPADISIGHHLNVVHSGAARPAATSRCGKPLVMRDGDSLFFLFDLGQVYRHANDRIALLQWWKDVMSTPVPDNEMPDNPEARHKGEAARPFSQKLEDDR
ncbi:MAG: beta-galactosidase, partial [Candidatus Faecivicinus sp.]